MLQDNSHVSFMFNQMSVTQWLLSIWDLPVSSSLFCWLWSVLICKSKFSWMICGLQWYMEQHRSVQVFVFSSTVASVGNNSIRAVFKLLKKQQQKRVYNFRPARILSALHTHHCLEAKGDWGGLIQPQWLAWHKTLSYNYWGGHLAPRAYGRLGAEIPEGHSTTSMGHSDYPLHWRFQLSHTRKTKMSQHYCDYFSLCLS